jgi:DNA polymerase
MKRSELGKVIQLIRNYIRDERNWGEHELVSSGKKIKKAETGISLEDFHKKISGCTKCHLAKTRINIVPGAGNPGAKLMFVGEGPGYEEDRKGLPFVGKAGNLLTKIIEAIGLKREDVFIGNIVKCHPMIDPSNPEKRGNDRPPNYEEISQCLPYIEKQIDIIKPEIICALGNVAAKTLLNTETGITKLRGRFYDYRESRLMPTFHPAAILRNPSLKRDVWEDMKKVRDALRRK